MSIARKVSKSKVKQKRTRISSAKPILLGFISYKWGSDENIPPKTQSFSRKVSASIQTAP
jgi:hypothetical protein